MQFVDDQQSPVMDPTILSGFGCFKRAETSLGKGSEVIHR